MSTNKPKRVITPLGTAVYPHLHTPDTKFDADGKYTIKVDIDKNEDGLLEFIEEIKKAADEAYNAERIARKKDTLKRAALPFNEGEDKITLKAEMKAKIVQNGVAIEMKPKLYKADNSEYIFEKDGFINNGARVRVAIALYPYYTATIGVGIKLRLQAVKVVENAPKQAANPFPEDYWDRPTANNRTVGFDDPDNDIPF